MKKIVSIMLCVSFLILVLAGCSESTGDKDKLVGSWKCDMDLTEQINSQFAADETAAEYLSVDEFGLTVCLAFHEDGTFVMEVDEASLDAAVEHLVVRVTEGVPQYMIDMVYAETGRELTIEEILEESGVTMEELVDQMFPVESLAALKEEMISGIQQEGKFKASEGKLHTSAGLEYEVDPEAYEAYILEGDTLTLLEYVGPETESSINVYPMVFQKVN